MNKSIENILKSVRRAFMNLTTLRPAGGLSVSDSAIRYVRLEGLKLFSASTAVPPGAIEESKIKDRAKIVEVLKDLRGKIDVNKSKKAEAILSLDSGPVYSQFFVLPSLTSEGINEAANLNVQMISPMNIAESYYGYEMIGGDMKSGGELEFLSAFVSSMVVNDWLSVLREAGFLPVVVEFRSLSLARLLSSLSLVSPTKIYLLVDINSSGINLNVIKNNHLYFDYFYSWKSLQNGGKEISLDKFKEVLVAEISKVINFSISKFGGEIKNILINAEGLQAEVLKTVKDQFKDLTVDLIQNPLIKYPGIVAALGAAFRGVMSRSEDKSITIGPVSVIDEYYQIRVLELVDLWRNVLSFTLLFLILTFSGGAYLLNNLRNRQTAAGRPILSASDLQELNALKTQAAEFDSLINLVSGAKQEENRLSLLIDKIAEATGGNITLTRISFQSIDMPIVLNGVASSPESVISFSKKLQENRDLVSDLQLPISSLIPSANGTTSFNLSFKVRTLNIK